MTGHRTTPIRLTSATRTREVTPDRFYTFAAVPTLGLTEGVERSWTQLLKTGDFWDPRYEGFSVTPETLSEILSNFQAIDRPVAGDFDHEAAFGSTEARAWLEDLELRADGTELWGHVAWLEDAAQAIRDGRYRYISPEFTHAYRDETGANRGAALLGFALTNRPFLEGMAEVTLAASPTGGVLLRGVPKQNVTIPPTTEDKVDPKQLARALGLPEDTPEATLLARAGELAAPAGAVVLSRDDHAQLLARAQAGDQAVEDARILTRDTAIQEAITAGRLAPALRDVTLLAWDNDPDATRKALDALPVNPAFKAAGLNAEDAEDQVPHQVRSDAPRSQQIHELAIAKQTADKTLSYRDAVYAAERELDTTKEA